MTKEQLEKAIRDYWADTSRSQLDTKGDLEELALLCEELAEVLGVDE